MMKMPTECWGMSSEDVWEKSRFDERQEIAKFIRKWIENKAVDVNEPHPHREWRYEDLLHLPGQIGCGDYQKKSSVGRDEGR